MASTVLTLKTKVAPTIQIFSVGFGTTSAVYVDVTGTNSTISVPNTQALVIRALISNGNNAAYNVQAFLGTTNIGIKTGSSSASTTFVWSGTSNQSGGSLTAKLQVTSSGGTTTVSRIVYCYGSFVSYSFNVKVQITSISFYELSDTVNAMMGNTSVGSNEALTVSTVNAISTNGLNFENPTGTCVFDWDGYYIGVSP